MSHGPTMAFTKKFMANMDEVPIRNHKRLAYALILRALRKRKNLLYAGTDNDVPLFIITEGDLKAELSKKHHGNIGKLFEEMWRYMLWTGLAQDDSAVNQIFLTAKAIDLGESRWFERHPVWFGTILGGSISFVSALILAFLKQYWLRKS